MWAWCGCTLHTFLFPALPAPYFGVALLSRVCDVTEDKNILKPSQIVSNSMQFFPLVRSKSMVHQKETDAEEDLIYAGKNYGCMSFFGLSQSKLK
jgi:hypothetical protein